jgi:hypothetical protein
MSLKRKRWLGWSPGGGSHPAVATWSGFEQPLAGLCTFGLPLPKRYASLVISGPFEMGSVQA